MLRALTGKLLNRHHQQDEVVENALLHSFGVHARNLIDFLWLERPLKRTDAIARDWIEAWQAPDMSSRLAGVKNRVGKEIVHLSYNRLDIPADEKGWLVIGIGPEVNGAFAKFATEVSDDLVPDGWRDRAYSAVGAISSEQAEQFLRIEDMRPTGLLPVPTQALQPSQGS